MCRNQPRPFDLIRRFAGTSTKFGCVPIHLWADIETAIHNTVIDKHNRFIINLIYLLFFATSLVLFAPISHPVLLAKDKNFEFFEQDREPKSEIFQTLSIIAELSPNPAALATEIILTVYGRIETGHHIYSVHSQGDFSPIPTKIAIKSGFLIPRSKTWESPPITVIDQTFDQPLKVHKNDFWLKRKFLLSSNSKIGKYQIAGYVSYQICDNRICSLPQNKIFRTDLTIEK